MTLTVLLLIPLVTAGLIALVRRRLWTEIAHILSALGVLGAAISVAVDLWRAPADGPETVAITALHGLLRADSLSMLMVMVIALLGTVAALYAPGYLRVLADQGHGESARLFFALFHLFIFTMLLAVTTDNLGVMWVAIEGTTLATVFLVNLHNTRHSLEAAYKYLIVSSVGIALAFVGTVLMYYAGAARAGEIAVNWTALLATAPKLDPAVVRLAFVFILIGYGTKAGLAPMHTWLPDAHSEAPAPISALMSGVLLNVGLYALLRFKAVADIAAGREFPSDCLLGLGLLSMTIAAAFLLRQRNYKRMLAYSSLEHIGIVCLGLGFGGRWGMLGALLHLVNHALSKSLLFILSGNILLKFRSTEIRQVRGLLRVSPLTGGAFLAGTLALVGLPPFALFFSEFLVFRAGLENGPVWVAVTGVGLLVVVLAGMLGSVNQMLYGEPPAGMACGDPLRWSLAPLAINFCLLIFFGLMLPPAYVGILERVVRVLGSTG